MLQDYGYGGYGDSPAKAYALDGSEGVRIFLFGNVMEWNGWMVERGQGGGEEQ